jgi:hypothetical protein
MFNEEDILKLNNEAYQKTQGIKIICGICKKKVNITYAVQCFYCNYWICRDCGKEHFSIEQAKKEAVKEFAEEIFYNQFRVQDHLLRHDINIILKRMEIKEEL